MAQYLGFSPDEDNYYFISYYSRDPHILSQTAKICKSIHDLDVKLWYDDGIDDGNDWATALAEHIGNAKAVLLFISNELLSSNEEDGESGVILEYSIAVRQKHTPVIPIFLNRIKQSDINDVFSLFYSSLDRRQGVSVVDCKSSMDAAKRIVSQLSSKFHSEKGNIHKHSTSMHPHEDYLSYIHEFIQWELSIPQKWGTYDISIEPQVANTIEGLFAMRASGYWKKKPTQFKKSLESVLQKTTNRGVVSKSIGKEVVIYTAMFLKLAVELRDLDMIINPSLLQELASLLWSIRNDDYGWGLFMEKAQPDECSMVNTYWALSSLYYYLDAINSNIDEYTEYVCSFFERENDGSFGFCIEGRPQLITTAMFLDLYYQMDFEQRRIISMCFPINTCIENIMHDLVEKNTQVIVETFIGISPPLLQQSARKAPWNHITIGMALSSLSKAYINGDLSASSFSDVLKYVDHVLENNTVSLENNRRTYYPLGIEPAPSGYYTFPTFHMIMGLSAINNGIEKFNKDIQMV